MSKFDINYFPILHGGNHNEIGNPHPQYILNKNNLGWNNIVKSSGNNLNKYVCLANIELPIGDNGVFEYSMAIQTGGNGTLNNERGEIYCKFRKQDEQISYIVYCDRFLNSNNFIYVLDKNDNNYVFKLFYKFNANWYYLNIKDNFFFYDGNFIKNNINKKLIDSLPALENENSIYINSKDFELKDNISIDPFALIPFDSFETYYLNNNISSNSNVTITFKNALPDLLTYSYFVSKGKLTIKFTNLSQKSIKTDVIKYNVNIKNYS